MKKYTPIILIITLIFVISCKDENELPEDIDVRQEMRNFVIELSAYAKNIKSDFIIIPQNGQALITDSGEASGNVNTEYISTIDATGREDLFYGYSNDNHETPLEDNLDMISLCNLFEQNDIEVLVTDYCWDEHYVDVSYYESFQAGFISFAASERELNVIPAYPSPIYNENTEDITDISKAMNFLYLINPENYSTKAEMLNAISQTNYDLIIIDLFFNDIALTAQDIAQIKSKNNGGLRKVVAYMSIREAENYRYYWKSEWDTEKPVWLEAENSSWAGNYKVRYWEQEWKDIIFGNNNSYLSLVLNAGFDGVYLDIIDGYEYFESEY
jgi:cysteinyl-tRNA synthetase